MRLGEVAVRILELDADDTINARRKAEVFATTLGHPSSVRSLVDSILEDQSLLEDVAHRSFHHSNHFDKIVLVSDGIENAYRLSIHLWRPPFSREEIADEQIHDHRCDFWSTILVGTLLSNEFERHGEGESYAEFRYRPSSGVDGAKRNEYRSVGLGRIRSIGLVSRCAGTTYYLPWKQIHRIVLGEGVTASLLLRGPYRTGETSLFSNSRPYEDLDLPPLSVDRLRDDLLLISERLP